MKILKARVNWMIGWLNQPDFQILVDRIPKLDELRYEARDGHYYAELDGYVNFFGYSAPGEGYGGRTFTLHMKDGSKADLIGPWSSRSGLLNAHGFGPCTEVAMTDDAAFFDRKKRFGCYYGGAITVPLAEEAARIAGVHLVRHYQFGDKEFYYTPSLKPGEIIKPEPTVEMQERGELPGWVDVKA